MLTDFSVNVIPFIHYMLSHSCIFNVDRNKASEHAPNFDACCAVPKRGLGPGQSLNFLQYRLNCPAK